MNSTRLVGGTVALAISAVLSAQEVRLQTSTPDFRTADDALAWGKERLAMAQRAPDPGARQQAALTAITAFQAARSWRGGVSTAIEGEATLRQAESFMLLGAQNNARRVIDDMRDDRIEGSGFKAQLYERYGEATELIGRRDAALSVYDRGLAGVNDPGWTALLHYRAGVSALELGKHLQAVKHLEQATPLLSPGSRRQVLAHAGLARAYFFLHDQKHAEALARSARELTRSGAPMATGEIPSFMPEPVGDQVTKYVTDTASLVMSRR